MSILTEKLLRREELSENEIHDLLWEDGDVSYLDTNYGENERWVRPAQSILLINGQLWAVDWYEGLTECQSNEYPYQPYRVEKKERHITVIDYVEVKE